MDLTGSIVTIILVRIRLYLKLQRLLEILTNMNVNILPSIILSNLICKTNDFNTNLYITKTIIVVIKYTARTITSTIALT